MSKVFFLLFLFGFFSHYVEWIEWEANQHHDECTYDKFGFKLDLKKVLYVSQMSLSAPSVDIRVSPSVTEINRDSTAKSVLYKPAQEAQKQKRGARWKMVTRLLKRLTQKCHIAVLTWITCSFWSTPPPRLGAEHVALPANGRGYWRAWESLFVLCMSL